MFKPAIRLSPQDFDAINTRLDQGTRLGDYMAGDMNARDADVNYVSLLSDECLLNGRFSGVSKIIKKGAIPMASLWPIFPGNKKELDKRGRLPYLHPPPDPPMQLMVVRVSLLTKRMILSIVL